MFGTRNNWVNFTNLDYLAEPSKIKNFPETENFVKTDTDLDYLTEPSKIENFPETENFVKTGTDESIAAKYLRRLLGQSKMISQMIAYIWLYDNETSSKLNTYFRHPDKLSEVLLAQPGDDAYLLLEEVFKNHSDFLPIFDKSEGKLYNFKIVFDQFQGCIEDPNLGESALITMVIPYPPRPQIFDDLNSSTSTHFLDKNAPLKASELQAWINQSPDAEPFYDQDNPYIPTTCS